MGNARQIPFLFHSFRGAYISFCLDKRGMHPLVGTDPTALAPHLQRLFAGNWKRGAVPPMWDGKAAERIVESLAVLLPD